MPFNIDYKYSYFSLSQANKAMARIISQNNSIIISSSFDDYFIREPNAVSFYILPYQRLQDISLFIIHPRIFFGATN